MLFLNRELVHGAPEDWTYSAVRQRTKALADLIVQIWPVPAGHKSGFSREKASPRRHRVGLSDLIAAGYLTVGSPFYARKRKSGEPVGVLLPDGRLEVQGTTFTTPSEAAAALTGHSTNGWWYLLVQVSPRRSLRDVWRDYVDSLAVDAEEETDDDGEDDEA